MFFNGPMTLSLRNGLLFAALGLLVVLTVGNGVLAFLLVAREGWTAQVGQASLLSLVVQTTLIPWGCLVGFIALRRVFRKSSAPEAFFFALFLVGLAGESLLLFQAWIHFSALPAYFTGVLTRLVWGFRFLGLAFLFCGSLFGFDFTFRKYGTMVLWSVVTAGFLASILPLHSSSARNHLLFAVGDAPGMVLVTVVLATAVALSYLAGSRRPGAPEQAWARAWAATFFLIAWGVTVSWGPWAVALGAPGVILATWKTEQGFSSP